MSGEVLINLTPMETRVAVVENGVLQEAFIERSGRRGIVGNIYRGKVVRVLPGMQAAFIDIGLERAAFIHAQEVMPAHTPHDEQLSIRELLSEGQPLVVQVTKDPIGTKGARLTTHLSVPSRYLVYMPDSPHTGVSQRIESDAERDRLKELTEQCLTALDPEAPGGFILRTAAEGISEAELKQDMHFLLRLWRKVSERRLTAAVPSVIYDDLPLFMRTLRDVMRDEIERVRIDSRENFIRLKEFASEFMPDMEGRIEYYPGERPIFDLFSVEDELHKAMGRKVQLKSGGYLVIDQTEAMTTIDVNTGGFVGHRNLEETIFKTNLEAATAIARQLRLRNLGGIIIIDFIDMEETEHQRQVLRVLEKSLERDHAKNKMTGVTELGLVQLTRKRTRESLEQVLCEACPTCQGRGTLKTPETVCYEIFREIMREERAYSPDTYMVLASQNVVDRLLDEESAAVADLESFIGKTIRFQVEAHYTQEQYDIVLM
ncbi:MAG: ribonuclease G [Cobetia sp.]|jgi:ribonuclease G|uniref:Ribonuclease G n=1 Tax=Cobetia amphilecti TaxID=1055104 RepID=A0ABT6UML2_9GAMM|nr:MULTISPECIES: ribonuclease G [Cobetia]AVV33581.1 ribonuclease G [Halomonas sp. SF2003]MBR9753975.1 ribonuclease G [Gammaproteobacteria bacterium]TCJ25064.1 ribonuclease G [Halomonas sp. GDM18]KGA02857.1 ribonuclease G [Cobetia amphilecti]KPM82121.1 ribonuclease G [Cobetia sp. UCD-24C]|tara:strand:+ start:270 stop:1733 length:1464 start_codon:yes stop_codon:yes gene_type:complete